MTNDERGLLRNTIGHACSSATAWRPSGTGNSSMYFLPIAFSNSGIIGVSVGPGFTQLMRIPCPREVERPERRVQR